MRALICWLFGWAPCPQGSPVWLCDFSRRYCIRCRLHAWKGLTCR